METLLGAYAVAWAIVSAYVLWIAVGNRRLAQRLDRLESPSAEGRGGEASQTKAA